MQFPSHPAAGERFLDDSGNTWIYGAKYKRVSFGKESDSYLPYDAADRLFKKYPILEDFSVIRVGVANQKSFYDVLASHVGLDMSANQWDLEKKDKK